jgi:putative SOS response-associated peptidase YedK
MCGRYGRRADKQHIAEHYAIRRVQYEVMPEDHPFAFAPDYNIAPDSFQPVVRLGRESGERGIAIMKAWRVEPIGAGADGPELLEPVPVVEANQLPM